MWGIVRGLVLLVVSVSAVADDVDEDVLFVVLPVFDCKADDLIN